MKSLLFTGSNGLIGSEMVKHFHLLGWTVHGLDIPQGDTRWNQRRLIEFCPGYEHHEIRSLVKLNTTGGTYRIYGYKGKQVGDNNHSYDAVSFSEQFIAAPSEGWRSRANEQSARP